MSSFRHSYAFVIGIDSYINGIPHLETAVGDATEITKMLETKHGYTVIRLLDEKATREQIQHVLEIDLLAQIQPDDRFLFYFAGHGIALNGDDGPEGYLISQNASCGNVSTYLPMSQVHNALLQLPCRHLLGILDCCFAGAFRWSSTRKLVPVELGTIHKERFDRFIQDPAWQVITSAAYDQIAHDKFDLKDDRGPKGGHSPFATALIEALEGSADAYPAAQLGKPAGDGVITATELYSYLRDRLEPETDARSVRQTPGIFQLKKHDKGEYIFLTPGHKLNLPPAPPLDVSSNPYRGLGAFGEKDKDLFFGRKALTQRLVEFVATHSLTVVLGASGSGKSSLVKAGLLPTLRQQQDWYLLPPLRPGASPFKALNLAIASVSLPNGSIFSDRHIAHQDLHPFLQQLANWFEKHPQAHLLVVIDQLEELITLDEQKRQQFLKLLAEAIDSHKTHLHLILTLRSASEPQFRNTTLEPNWQAARFVVPAMTREELRQAIEEPASAKVMYFDPHELADQLIDEVANMPGALPLLSFALSELYLNYLKRQETTKLRGETLDRTITQADYENLGGVMKSLTQRAEQEYEALLQQDSAYAQTIQHVMLRMVAVGDELTRRRVLISELVYSDSENQRVQKVIQRFLDARLLVSGLDMEARAYLEPAHDALVQGWQRLIFWKKKEQETLILQRRLTPAAAEWQRQQETKYLWNSDPRLDLLEQILHSSNSWFNQTETEFVTRSLQHRQKNKFIRWGLFALAFVTLGSFTAFILFQLIQTDLREKSARVENLMQDDPVEGLLLAIQTTGQNQSRLPWGILAPVESSLLKAVQSARERNRFTLQSDSGSINYIEAVAISPNGQRIATINNLGSMISLWDLNGQQVVQLAQDSMETFESISFSADSNIVIASDLMKARQVKFWNIDGRVVPLPFKQATSSLITMATFTPDGKKIITGSDNGQLRIWDTQGNPLTEPFLGKRNRITAIALSPNGTTIASGDEAGKIQLWTSEGVSLGELPQAQERDRISSIQFSPDGQKVLVHQGLSGSSHVVLWHFQRKRWIDSELEQAEVPDSGGFTTSATFTANGEGVITGHTDGHVRLWKFISQSNGSSPDRKMVDEFLPTHSGNISDIALTPDGKNIVTTSVDGVVKIWDLKPDSLVKELLPGEQRKDVESLISSDGHGMVVSKVIGQNAVIQFWNFEGNQIQEFGKSLKQPLQKPRTRYMNLNLLSFNMDKQQVLLGSPKGDLRVWDSSATARSALFNSGTSQAGLSPNGQKIVTGDSNLKLWNLDGKMLNERSLDPISGATSNITNLAFSPDGFTIATVNSPEVCLWQLKDDTLTKQLCQLIGEPSAIAFSLDSKVLGIGNERGVLYLWDLTSNRLSPGLQIHPDAVDAIAFSPSNTRIVSGDRGGRIQLSTAKATNIGPLSSLLSFDPIKSLAFSPDGNAVVSSNSDGAVRRYPSDWQDWLKVGCDRLRNHPVLREPKTQEQKEAKETCQQLVWSRK